MIEKVLIVGLGSAGRRHLEIAHHLCPDADIRVLRRAASSENVVVAGKSTRVIKSLGEAEDFAPEVSVICSPASHHISVAKNLVRKGSHLLIEKPLSDSTYGVNQLLSLCRDNKRVLQVGYNLRYTSSLREFRNKINEKLVGKIFSIRCEIGQWLPSWRPNKDYRQTVSGNRNLGGGVLLELSHEIDYLSWIFGPIEWVRATIAKTSSLEIDVEDHASLILGMENGEKIDRPFCSLIMDFVRHDATRSCLVIGDKGVLRWNGLRGEVSLLEAGDTEWKILHSFESDLSDSYTNEWIDFLKCVEEGGKPLVSGEDGLSVLAVVEAARRSSTTGQQVLVQVPQ